MGNILIIAGLALVGYVLLRPSAAKTNPTIGTFSDGTPYLTMQAGDQTGIATVFLSKVRVRLNHGEPLEYANVNAANSGLAAAFNAMVPKTSVITFVFVTPAGDVTGTVTPGATQTTWSTSNGKSGTAKDRGAALWAAVLAAQGET